MTTEQLTKMIETKPFKPFEIDLADGRSIPVKHPEFVARSRSGRTISVWGPDEAFETIDLLLVTSLKELNGSGSGRRKRR